VKDLKRFNNSKIFASKKKSNSMFSSKIRKFDFPIFSKSMKHETKKDTNFKKYNKSILILFLSILIIFFIYFVYTGISTHKTTLYYLTPEMKIKSEKQIIPKNMNLLQITRFYFDGPINVKNFKKDIFQLIEVDNVYIDNNTFKIVLSMNSSLLFMNYDKTTQNLMAKTTFDSLKNFKDLRKISKIEFFINNNILYLSYPEDK